AGKRLPTAVEWEAAISHPEGKLFPWCDEWPGDMVLSRRLQPSWILPETTAVATGERGRSISSIEDFAGQVSEWTSRVMPHHGVQFRMLRGGSWFHRDPVSFRSAFGYAHEGWRSAFTGFRCALDGNATPSPSPQSVSTATPMQKVEKVPSIPKSEESIQIQAGSDTSCHVSILVPFLGSERFGLSAPEGASWDGGGLLNWYDKRDLKWEVSTPKRASYVMSLPNLQLNAEFVAGDDFVDQVFTVMNHTGKSGRFRSSSCFNLQPHPLFYDCEGLRTYALTKDNMFVLLREFKRPGECVRWITGSVGAELEGLRWAMLAVLSQDGKWIIGCARADRDGSFSVSCNTCFTCLHADSSYPVDESRSSRLRMYFLKGGLDDLLARFDSDIRQDLFR
ncbi:formylglycine-generating enzyme family protein, partial [Candidatus Poribacteria bacterium]